MREQKEWSTEVEEQWYMANRRLRAWVWASKMGALPIGREYRNFKQALGKIRKNPDRSLAKDSLVRLIEKVDTHLYGALNQYLDKIVKEDKGDINSVVERIREDADKKEYDPIIFFYLANAFHKIKLSEKNNPEVSNKLRDIKDDLIVMIELFNQGNLDGALANLQTIIARHELTGFSMNDTAVTLAALMYDLKIPVNIFEKLTEKAENSGLIGRDYPVFLYLIDLREAVKYAKLVGKYLEKEKPVEGIDAGDEIVEEIELLLTSDFSSGVKKEPSSPEVIISDILPHLEGPEEKLDFIKDEMEMQLDASSKNTKGVVLLGNEMMKIIRENKENQDVRQWVLSGVSEKNNVLMKRSSRFSLSPLSTNQRALRDIYAKDNQMLIALRFAEVKGGDPFKTTGLLGAIQNRLFGLNRQINRMPVEDIATYMIAHPEHAEFFLKKRSGLSKGRDFRKELLNSPVVVEKMIVVGGVLLNNLLIDAEIISKEQVQEIEKSIFKFEFSEDSGEDESIESLEVAEWVEGRKSSVSDGDRNAGFFRANNESENPSTVMPESDAVNLESTKSPEETAAQLIGEIEDIVAKNSSIDADRKLEVGVEMRFFRDLIKLPKQAENIINALKAIKRSLVKETSSEAQLSSGSPEVGESTKIEMSSGDIMGAVDAIEKIEKIEKILEQGTTIDEGRLKEIQEQLQALFSEIKNKRWVDEEHRPLLDFIEKEVEAAQVKGSAFGNK